jgi:phage tail-like protein
MRGAVDGLPTAFPLGAQMPSVYAEDEMAQRFTRALDDLLAPFFAVLDCLPSYFDPLLAPDDFVAWLGTWLGAEVSGDEPERTLRTMVAGAARAHRLRGTAAGVREAVRLAFGVAPEVVESGGAAWSARPLGAFPGDPSPRMTVRLRAADPDSIDRGRLERVVASVRPAHIPCTVEVLRADTGGDRSR